MAEDRMLNDEILLGLIKANGGGGGGTTNYNQLSNKPQINSVELSGNKSLSDLGIASASALANKVDKIDGKGLSTNDYDNTEKAQVATNAEDIVSLKSGLMSRAVIAGCGEISSNSSATVDLISGHLYIVILGHPYSEGGMAIVASYTSGSNKVTWIKSKTGVTISEDDNVVLTISAEATVWYTVVDIGTVYN